MSFDPGRRNADIKDPGQVVLNPNLMAERTHLPDMDYRALRLGLLKGRSQAAKAPADRAGRYQPLVEYLRQRGSQVDAAEVDRRMRTWFEDMIDRVIKDPAAWDKDQVLKGKALMDFLAGQTAAPSPEQDQATGQRQPGGPA